MFIEENRKKIITISVILLIIVIFVFYILPLFFESGATTLTILPSEVVIDEEKITLKTGETYSFVSHIYPSDATETEIEWMSNDTMVVTINETGTIEAIRPGTAVVSVTTVNELMDFVVVEVVASNEDAYSLSLNMEDISLNIGTMKRFEVKLSPIGTKYESIEWVTNNSKVVSINKNGEVYGLTTGNAIITAKVKIDSTTILSISSKVTVVR